ncbi:MAG: exodeoxyribonuclease VII small subunit [Victivallaceae bacterium]|nr:exodeoxyribonuclease VII small subunit [Victivallaceae bacterium]
MAAVEIDNKTSFEEALDELEKLLAAMESGKKPLEQLIADFERGMALAKYCRTKLAALEKRIEILAKDDGGDGEWAKFEPKAVPDGAPRQ